MASTFIVKSPGTEVPPSSLMTFVITNSVPRVGWSSAVTVHVRVSPAAMGPPQPGENEITYPRGEIPTL